MPWVRYCSDMTKRLTVKAGGCLAAVSALLLTFSGCGAEPDGEAVRASPTSGAEAPAPSAGMDVSGLMGTIPERKIHATLEPKLPSFQRCFMQGAEEVEMIGGEFEFYFRVGLDGNVEWVYPRASTVGHRATERCLLETARKVRFPRPRGGGAAELAWGFAIDGVGDVRAPVSWDAARVSEVVEAQRAALAACGSGRFRVTAYVEPGGAVMAAGAAVDEPQAAEAIDCVVEAVASWTLPDPGSYPAKVSFTVSLSPGAGSS